MGKSYNMAKRIQLNYLTNLKTGYLIIKKGDWYVIFNS